MWQEVQHRKFGRRGGFRFLLLSLFGTGRNRKHFTASFQSEEKTLQMSIENALEKKPWYDMYSDA